MNEPVRSLEVIEAEINFYKNQAATGIIETGKRLIEAKQQLKHGEWGEWLEKKVEFSQETARQFMRVAKEFGNSNTCWNLPYKKLFLLTTIPQENREEFIHSTHEVHGEIKTVDEMTSRELQQVIKERDKLKTELNTAKGKIEYQQDLIQKKETSIQELAKREPVVIEKEKPPADYEQAKKDAEILKLSNAKLSEAYSKIIKDKQSLEKELESLKKVNEAAGEYKNKVIESALFFVGKVHNFIEQVGGLAWVAGEINKLPDNERKAYLKSIQLVKDWTAAVSYEIDKEQGKFIEEKGR